MTKRTTQSASEPLAVSVAEAARMLSVSESSIRDLLTQGKLQSANVGTGKVRSRLRILVSSIKALVTPPAPVQVDRKKKPAKVRKDFISGQNGGGA